MIVRSAWVQWWFCVGLWMSILGISPAHGASTDAKTFDGAALLSDPGFERWFSGAIRIQQGDRVLFEVYRGADASGEPFDESSLFWLASNSKVLTAAVMVQLADEGLITLTDPIGMHLPGWNPEDLRKAPASWV